MRDNKKIKTLIKKHYLIIYIFLHSEQQELIKYSDPNSKNSNFIKNIPKLWQKIQIAKIPVTLKIFTNIEVCIFNIKVKLYFGHET